MKQEIKTITLALPYRLGRVNCYLLGTDAGHVLIDTGGSNRRAELEKELESGGCTPDSLKLIVLTHGDFDHTGNAAYLCRTFGAEVAMHSGDAGMVERGDMFWNRRRPNILIRAMTPILFAFGKSKRFVPDLYIEEGHDLSEYGFDARVVSIPGHSKGSIGILTPAGDLFCGDLLENTGKPGLNTIMDDVATAKKSVEKLRDLGVNTVYPGHGCPFLLEEIPMDSDNAMC